VSTAVHRIIEERAAARPEVAAIVDEAHAVTYRELNQRANSLARRLCESGLTRGALAFVRMPRSSDLAIVLLAVLKAGASYAWIEPGSAEDAGLPAAFCIRRGHSADDERYLAIDIESALRESAARPGPNLPVLSRGSDVACVLPDSSGRPHVLVPHATIVALPSAPAPRRLWEGTAGALDLWLGLMSGATLAVGVTPAVTAAA
jgi:non-ribosomal peptide synthetase component F